MAILLVYNVLLFKTASPPRENAALRSRQIPICKIALLLNMMIWKKPDKTARNGAIGVKMQMIAASTASVSHPYQCVCMDNSTCRKIMTSSKKNICCNPAITIPFSVHLHTSMLLKNKPHCGKEKTGQHSRTPCCPVR